MHSRVLIAICVLLATAAVAQSRRWFASEVSCWITQEKVPASWEDAQRYCEIDGAVLASPLNLQLFNYMQSLINVHNHSAAYFIGTRVNRSDDGQKVNYVSVEGRRLDDMPRAVYDAIDQLDLEQGDCLSMDRHGIRAVSCWDHLPYICYSNETTEYGSVLATTKIPCTTTTAPTTTTTAPTTTTTASTTTTTVRPTLSPFPAGYTYYPATGSAYKLHERRVTWQVANTTCAGEGTHVTVLNDAQEADIVARIVDDALGSVYAYYTWTGLYNRAGGVMEWRTVHGEHLSNVYHVWWFGRPLNNARNTCACFYTGNKRLLDTSCTTDANYFVCEISQQ